jgi:hypothetical protein
MQVNEQKGKKRKKHTFDDIKVYLQLQTVIYEYSSDN